ncbi:MAG: hypothetical protein J7K53_03775 [Bacteroidales bacterium]|nr:hypothetical protein [Bacteroidales bacterium]
MTKELENKNQPRANDEIDLLELFNKMGKGIKRFIINIWDIFLKVTVFFIRKSPYLIAFIILGFLVALLKFKTSDRYYSSDMTLRSNSVSNADMIAHINKLHFYGEEENMQALAQTLNLDSNEVANLVDIEAYWIIDENRDGIPDMVDDKSKYDEDTTVTHVSSRFDVRVKTKQPQDLDIIREGILHHINTNRFFEKINTIRLIQLRDRIAKTATELSELDSLQNYKYFEEKQKGKFSEGQMVFLNEPETKLYHGSVFELYGSKQGLDRELEIYSDIVTVLDNFTPPAQPENSYLHIAKTWVIVCFLLGLIFVVVLSFRKELISVYRKY